MELKELINVLKDVLSQQQILVIVILYLFYRWFVVPLRVRGRVVLDIIDKYLEIQEKQVGGIWRLCDKVDSLIQAISEWKRGHDTN